MKCNKVSFCDVNLTDGFFESRRILNRDVTLGAVRDRFADTGRFAAFEFNWKDGDPLKPHIFWDSDIAKWLESAAYILKKDKNPELEAYCDRLIDLIEKNQCEDGYFNIYFSVVEPDNRFTVRDAHELYCAGHLMEAAVAYCDATGKDKLLGIVDKYADCIIKAFVTEKTAEFSTPGHEEIELALVKMYEFTGDDKYLKLSRHFIDTRATADNDDNVEYNQSHIPVREMSEAVGHSVRACYLYTAMADIARLTQDEELLAACRRLFDNITQKRMYVTGGIGSTRNGERFTIDYDLCDTKAYAETCAAISLCYFAQRMTLAEPDGKYADIVEKTLFNSIISGISLDGISFFYENPLEINLTDRKCYAAASYKHTFPITQRVEVFGCSCCPPNITRLMATVGDYIYACGDDTLYVNQYFANNASFMHNGKAVRVELKTRYPEDGDVVFTLDGGFERAAFRIPSWCEEYSLCVDGTRVCEKPVNGYVYIELGGRCHTVELSLRMSPRLVYANPALYRQNGKAALMRGPLVYCIEGVDNGENLDALSVVTPLVCEERYSDEFGAVCCEVGGVRRTGDKLYGGAEDYVCEPCSLKYIPYYAFANRGESSMKVWVRTD